MGLHGCYMPGATYGFMIGYPIGVIIGFLLVNRLLHYRGSLLCGALSIIAGGAIVMGVVFIVEKLTYGLSGSVFNAPGWTAAAILFFFLGPPLLADTTSPPKVATTFRMPSFGVLTDRY